MNIAVMGAGAVGCYYGAMLARAGHSVVLIGRAQHVHAVNDRGLLIEALTFHEHVSIQATTEPSGVAGADVVLFCTKSADTETAGQEISSHLIEDVIVLSLQNGVDNVGRLQAVVGRTVVPGVVYVATEMAGPGHVRHRGGGDLVIGPSPKSTDIAAKLIAAGIATTVSENAIGALWGKLIVNCAYNALSAVSQLPYGRLLEVDGVMDVMMQVVDECLAVASRSGISVPGDTLQTVVALAGTMPDQYSSTAQDVARGKKSEIDYLNGFIVRKGAALGIPTPSNRVLHTMVKLAEAKGPR
ncbi:2-dehydropantoate 2-reductase [Mesorhizobium sp. M7A.F.Ca.US.006.01.1.1]|uniref:ketopantoate reductase family protein n=1 Tax=Mesorhizobium sp. M7A.F.Ca.US.006.01.1.1 TaxID=2496707 RepID=UPI000FCAD670|nr:2-dehydropantoate 2-reductase [Mesorhizobium sp. M7A.F.Ca.US.006.01.1.1]RUZ74233.1 2-dehydropantoate 2-reductase [Mesorhizobium sp. M7A.F.Ca.US.006.01.1.1]